jgi:hypothetical protein
MAAIEQAYWRLMTASGQKRTKGRLLDRRKPAAKRAPESPRSRADRGGLDLNLSPAAALSVSCSGQSGDSFEGNTVKGRFT